MLSKIFNLLNPVITLSFGGGPSGPTAQEKEETKVIQRDQRETRKEQESEIARRASGAKGKGKGRRSLLSGSAKGIRSTTLGQ